MEGDGRDGMGNRLPAVEFGGQDPGVDLADQRLLGQDGHVGLRKAVME
jgi:hypothetical protein